MAIRFQCAACSQPIEVDDEWAMKLVACPYCRRTVTAPRESFLPELAQIPTAKPSGEAPYLQQGTAAVPTIPYPSTYIAPRRNHVATVALVLASLAMMFLFANMLVARQHNDEILKFNEALTSGGFRSVMEAQQKMIQENGGLPPTWMMTIALLQLCGGAMWLAGLICALVGMRQVYDRRDKAVATLIISGAVPLVYCCGGAILN